MVSLVKVTSLLSLIISVQLIQIQSNLATDNIQNLNQIHHYEPPNHGCPDSSQAAGTR